MTNELFLYGIFQFVTRHLICHICFMTIVSSSPHGLQRTCICTVYKQTYRQLQAEMDSLCQFLFRENALCMSGIITFALNSKRERNWAKNRDTGEMYAVFWRGREGAKTLLCPPPSECPLSHHKCERLAHQQGLDLDSYWLWVTYDACGRLSSIEY